MVLTLELLGGLIVGAALLQTAVGLVGLIAGTLRQRRLDQSKIAAFTAQTDILLKRAEAERQREVLTWSGKRKFRIRRRQVENKAGDICSFYLEPHDHAALAPFLPGQFLTFELRIPGQLAPVVRCYSLSDSPLVRDTYRVSIRRVPPPPKAGPEVRGGLSSSYFHDNLKEGDLVDVRAPKGGFCLKTESDRAVVLIAGGIGVTPLLSMFKWLAQSGSHRQTWLFYATRNSQDIALREEIREMVDSSNNFHAVILFSDPTEQCIVDKDYDGIGFLDIEVLKTYLKSSNYEFYVCGPPPMMEKIIDGLTDWGVPEADIHFEAFGAASVKRVHRSDQAVPREGSKIEFLRSGKSLVWTKEAGTLLELADANGIRVNSGCRAGNCSTCTTAVVRGKVAYVARPASKPAQGSALLCIAEPEGDVALDA